MKLRIARKILKNISEYHGVYITDMVEYNGNQIRDAVKRLGSQIENVDFITYFHNGEYREVDLRN